MTEIQEPSRRERKKAQTRQAIYDAAMKLFQEQGYAGTSIVEICEAADVGHGTFFLHFPTKSALIHEFSQRLAEEALDAVSSRRASAREELVALVERLADELDARAEIMRAMLAEFFENPETLASSSEAGAALRELVTSIIERGQERGEFDPEVDARLAAASFLATAGAIISGQVYERGEVSRDEAKRQFLQHVFHGLAPVEP
jgi:AcrR family transcriptional regulator